MTIDYPTTPPTTLHTTLHTWPRCRLHFAILGASLLWGALPGGESKAAVEAVWAAKPTANSDNFGLKPRDADHSTSNRAIQHVGDRVFVELPMHSPPTSRSPE